MKTIKLAFFDFDQTLIKENSLATLFKAVSGKRVLFPSALTLVFRTDTYKKGVKSAIKRRLYKRCLAGVSEQQMATAAIVATTKLNLITEVSDKLQQLHANNHQIWIITAAPTAFITAIVKKWQLPVTHIIGTNLYQRDGIYSGEFASECEGLEKVTRIKQMLEMPQYHTANTSIEVAYGNLPIDIAMMSLALKSYAVKNGKIVVFKS